MKSNKPIEIKYENLDQYDYSDEDLMIKKEKKYASLIGSFLIWFSNLEHNLNIGLADLISERSHEDGYVIIKDMGMFQKIELFYNLAFPRVNFAEKRKAQKLKQLPLIRRQLEELNTFRNKVAHAKWNTLDKEGYVRVEMITDKENGFIKFKKFKISPEIIKGKLKEIVVLENKLYDFIENIWQ
jgi:hypothetical protein